VPGELKNHTPENSGVWLYFGLRREGDSNPRTRVSRSTVFETAPFDHSGISPPQKYQKCGLFLVLPGHYKNIQPYVTGFLYIHAGSMNILE
jgi:hypothetical protein